MGSLNVCLFSLIRFVLIGLFCGLLRDVGVSVIVSVLQTTSRNNDLN